VALGIPEDTSNKALERAEDVMAPLVATATNIVNDAMLLANDYLKEVDGPAAQPASP
jgi:hypothetical protein